MKIERHHKIIVSLAIVFLVAWAVWTFVLLPASEVSTGQTSPTNAVA